MKWRLEILREQRRNFQCRVSDLTGSFLVAGTFCKKDGPVDYPIIAEAGIFHLTSVRRKGKDANVANNGEMDQRQGLFGEHLPKKSSRSLPTDMASMSLQSLEARARSTESSISSAGSPNAQLAAAIKAADLYMQTLLVASNASDKRRLDSKCKELLALAESIKIQQSRQKLRQPTSSRELTTRERIILLEGCKLNGFVFPPWKKAPEPSDFELKDGQGMYVDLPQLQLSPLQLESFAGWKRPRDAFVGIKITQNNQQLSTEPNMVMTGSQRVDLVQDMTSDCSVVASLCAGTARAEKGHPMILSTIMSPYNHERGRPAISATGKYVLRLCFNGCYRRVEIDDFLPVSNNSRVLHVIDRNNPGLLWPALVEKAYLKVRGGYDFPGSNSGTDLAVLSGWIPEQVFLHDQEVVPEELWDRILLGFKNGDVLLTIGTGKLPKREQRQLGLAAEHDYAILHMKESEGIKEMLIKNPWSDGDVWTGATRQRPNPSSDDLQKSIRDLSIRESDVEMTPGTFWMDFGSVFQYFENLYLNWNPALFQHREDIHFTWDTTSSDDDSGTFAGNPQFSISSSRRGEVWLMLNKHFKTGDYTVSSSNDHAFISLYIFSKGGQRVIQSEGAVARGPYVDSPNTLLKFTIPANACFTVVIASQSLSASKHNFTLSAFSQAPTKICAASVKYPNMTKRIAAWTRSTAGGNSDSPNYLANPQFAVTLSSKSDIAVLLGLDNQTDSAQITIHSKIIVVYTNGTRVTKLRIRDIVANSGDYRARGAALEATLEKGTYTIICSTFERDQYAKFTLSLFTSSTGSSLLKPLPAEGSGRLSILAAPAIFSNKTNRLLAPLTIPRLTRARFIARGMASSAHEPKKLTSTLLLKLSIEQGQGPYKACLASSSSDETEFSDAATGVRVGDIDLRPDMYSPGSGGLWLVIERMPGASDRQSEEAVEIEILAEERVELGPWGLGDG